MSFREREVAWSPERRRVHRAVGREDFNDRFIANLGLPRWVADATPSDHTEAAG